MSRNYHCIDVYIFRCIPLCARQREREREREKEGGEREMICVRI